MRVLIYTYGTRGDAQPHVALARRLAADGHTAVLAGPARFAELADEHGVTYASLSEGGLRYQETQEAREHLTSGKTDLRAGTRQINHITDQMPGLLREFWKVAEEGADVIVHQPGLVGHHIAEKLGVPAVTSVLQPGYVPTRTVPCAPFVHARLPGQLNLLSYQTHKLANRAFSSVIDAWRSESLNLAPRRHRHNPFRTPGGERAVVLHAFSPIIFPPPSDWPESVVTTGYWNLPASYGWNPSPELNDFLDAGETPLYIGFGSLVGSDPAANGQFIMEAVRRAGVRAIVATGGGGIDVRERSDDVLVIQEAPHEWLFPRVRAIVHAGGAGTTAAAALAGKPQAIAAFHNEQLFWGRATQARGVAPSPIRQRDLSSDRLTSIIRDLKSREDLAAAADDVGRALRNEDGVGQAVRVIERQVIR